MPKNGMINVQWFYTDFSVRVQKLNEKGHHQKETSQYLLKEILLNLVLPQTTTMSTL